MYYTRVYYTGSSHLKIEVFREIPANRERQEVMWSGPWRQVCGLRFTFVRLDHAAEVSDILKGFLHPKTLEFHVCEEIQLFTTLLLILISNSISKKRNFEDNFSAKNRSKRMNENKHGSRELPSANLKSQIWVDG